MALPIGAIVKKAAMAVGSNKKVWKTIGGIALGILILLFMPIIALLGIFSGGLDIDTDGVMEDIENHRPIAEEILLEIDERMTDAGFGAVKVQEAQALYLFGLFDKWTEPGFAQKLVACYERGQTDEQLVAAVNETFGTEITAEEYAGIMQDIRNQAEKEETG